GFLGRLTLVVDVERTATPGHRAVVDDRALVAGHATANKSGERRGFLAIEVGFEPVTNGFVQQDAGPSRTKDDFHFSGGSFTRVELQDRLAGRFFREVLGSFFSEEEIESNAATAARRAASGLRFGFRDARDVHARERLRVFGEGSVGGDDENVTEFVGVAGANFFDTRIVGAR